MLQVRETLLVPVRAYFVLPPHAVGRVVLEIQELLLQHEHWVAALHDGLMLDTAYIVRECFCLPFDTAKTACSCFHAKEKAISDAHPGILS